MKKIFIFISVAALMFSCLKDAEHQILNNYPFPTTHQATDIDKNGVTLVGSVKQGRKIMLLIMALCGVLLKIQQ